MKPLSPRSRLKGDPFLPNRFIFGDAIEAGGIEQYEYLIHTEQPAFICRIMRREIAFAGAEKNALAGAVIVMLGAFIFYVGKPRPANRG